jgi:hypothetical protein
MRAYERLTKWFEGFKDTLDREEIELAVLSQKELFYLMNARMDSQYRVKPSDIESFCDEDWMNEVGRLTKDFKAEWNGYFNILASKWRVEIAKRSLEDKIPDRWHKLGERAFTQFNKNPKKVVVEDEGITVEVSDQEAKELVEGILEGTEG